MQTLNEQCDVFVAGGGTAGTIAAIQSARTGARTVVSEMSGQLGGTITNGGVRQPAHFWTSQRQVIAGIGWELITKTLELDGDQPPDFLHPPPRRPQWQVGINRCDYALVAEEAALQAGVILHYHEIVTDVSRQNDSWLIHTTGKNIHRKIFAREIIDCTGDADVVGMLGLPRERGNVRQPGTIALRITGYDHSSLNADLVRERYHQAMSEGRLKPGDFHRPSGDFMQFLRLQGGNQIHVFNADSTTSATQTEANINGRGAILRLLRFIKTLPGCENVKIESMLPDTAVRETWRIVGETTITENDYTSGRIWYDSVCYSFYFIDLHTENGASEKNRFLTPGIEPTIPLRALIPRDSSNLLVAGRCLASDRLANSALRVQASCMAMGQAAGAAAALGVQMNIPSREVPIEKIRVLLKHHAAIIPPE